MTFQNSLNIGHVLVMQWERYNKKNAGFFILVIELVVIILTDLSSQK